MPYLTTRMKHLTFEQQFVLKLYPPTKEQLGSTNTYQIAIPKKVRIQKDPVLRFVRQVISELQKERIDVSAMGFHVFPLTRSPPIWPQTRTNARNPTKLYVVMTRWNEFPQSVVVSVEHRHSNKALTADRIMLEVQRGHDPVPLKEALLSWTAKNFEKHRIDRKGLQLWWKNQNQPFRLMDLPLELRRAVYLAILGSQIRPDEVLGEVILGSKHNHPMWEEENAEGRCTNFLKVLENELSLPNYALLGVSKQVREEALDAAWIDSEKHFYNIDTLNNVLKYYIDPITKAKRGMGKVVLNFDLMQWFELFGLKANPNVTLGPHHWAASQLQSTTDILELSLIFPNPYKYRKHPWSLFDWGESSRKWPCYRFVIDWIMTAALPYIKHIPNVRLRGAIKTATKRKWHTILHNEFLLGQGKGVPGREPFDYDKAMQDIKSIPPGNMPPACSCPKSCNHDFKAPFRYCIRPSGNWHREILNREAQLRSYFDRDDSFSSEEYRKELEKCVTETHESRTGPVPRIVTAGHEKKTGKRVDNGWGPEYEEEYEEEVDEEVGEEVEDLMQMVGGYYQPLLA